MLSLIIPMYNSAKTIEATLHSVVNQTLQFTEVIVVDNGSDDSSIQIVSQFCEKYSYIQLLHCEIRGVSAARNMGIEYAKCAYISFLDADDILEPIYVETIENAISNNPSSDMYHFNFYHQFKNGIIKENPYFLSNQEEYTGTTFMEQTLKRFSFEAKHMVWTFAFKKAFLDTYQLRFNKNMKIFEDILFLHNVWEKSQSITVLKNTLLTYNWNRESLTNKNEVKNDVKGSLEALYNSVYGKPVRMEYVKKLSSRLLDRKSYCQFWAKNRNENTSKLSIEYGVYSMYYTVLKLKRRRVHKK